MADPDRVDVAAVMAKFPGPVRLYGDKKFLRYVLGVFALIEFGLVKGLITGDGTHLIAVCILIAILLWGLGLTAYVMLNRNALAMDLDGDGFTVNYYAWYRPLRRAWSDVDDFGTRTNRVMDSTTYNDRPAGRSRLFLDTYGLGAGGLAQLMSQWRQRALASQA
jgi:hypothetical protein